MSVQFYTPKSVKTRYSFTLPNCVVVTTLQEVKPKYIVYVANGLNYDVLHWTAHEDYARIAKEMHLAKNPSAVVTIAKL